MLAMSLGWILKCIFSCGHLRTPVSEGKCYCPDCGRGVIYQWVVVRCNICRTRVDSHMVLRQLMPLQRCCPACGEQDFNFEYLDAPSYFQLHKAQLVVREEHDYLQGRFFHWNLYTVGQALHHTVEQTLTNTHHWLTSQTPQTAPRLLPAPVTIQA